MRNIDANLLTYLSSAGTSICELLLIKTAGGTELVKLTSHTENVTITMSLGGPTKTFLARPGIFGSKVSSDISFSIDNSEVGAYITSGVINLNTLYGQHVEGARFERYVCDYENPTQHYPYLFHTGFIGEIPINDYAFKVALRSLVAALHQPVGTVMQPLCRSGRLGETGTCNFPMTYGGGMTHRAPVSGGSSHTFRVASFAIASGGVINPHAFQVNSVTHPTGWFDNGVLTWISTTNGNNGLQMEVRAYSKSGSTGLFSLQDRPGGDLVAGDTFTIDAGCNRTPGHCYWKFRTTDVGDATYPAPSSGVFADTERAGAEYAHGNMHNYQGEPHLTDESDLLKNAGDWDRVTFNVPTAPVEVLE